MNLYKSIFEALGKAGVEYLIVGGVAVNLYGYNRFTGDIDILLALTPKNLEKMDKLMRKLGYIERLPVSVKEKGLKAYTFISDGKPQLDIDIIIHESMDFLKYSKQKTVIEVWEMELPVIHIDDLIGMKKAANRAKDRLDLEALIQLKTL